MSKTVLITGASRGIGYAMAEAFAKAGCTVYANYYQTPAPLEALCQTLAETGRRLVPVYADVRRAEEVAAMAAQAGNVDLLINNAGIAQTVPFAELTARDWDEMMEMNLKSAFLCTQAVLPGMLREKRGHILNISSVWGVTGGSCEVHYSAAKAGLIGMTKALAKELGPSGIRVNCLAPGAVETDMLAGLDERELQALREQAALGVIGQPGQIAAAALMLDGNELITGEVINVNGGFFI